MVLGLNLDITKNSATSCEIPTFSNNKYYYNKLICKVQ